MVTALKNNQPVCFLPFFKQSLVEKRAHELLLTLDQGEPLKCRCKSRNHNFCFSATVISGPGGGGQTSHNLSDIRLHC